MSSDRDEGAAGVIIRTAGESDLRVIRELFEEYAGALGFGLSFQRFDEELATLPGAYTPPKGLLLLAEIDGKPVGCVGLRPLDDEDACCELKRMYVRPTHRGRGVGRALAVAIIRAAREREYARMRLDTIDTMVAAIALYSSLGFVEIPPYRPNPIIGASFFELSLDAPHDL